MQKLAYKHKWPVQWSTDCGIRCIQDKCSAMHLSEAIRSEVQRSAERHSGAAFYSQPFLLEFLCTRQVPSFCNEQEAMFIKRNSVQEHQQSQRSFYRT